MKNKVSFANASENDEHYRRLKRMVRDSFDALPTKPLIVMRVRAIGLVALYFILYGTALVAADNVITFYSAFALMGMVIVLLFLNVIHEAVHGTLFKSKTLNHACFYLLDTIGANSYIFRKRHVNLHHNFPNVDGWDSDIEQASLVKIFPHGEPAGIHRIQHRIFGLLYPIYLVNWVFVRDFKDFFMKTQVVRKVCKNIPLVEYVKLFVFKCIFLFYTVGVPILIGVHVMQAVAALLCMLIVAGTFALIVLLTPHVNVTNDFPLPEEDNRISSGWFLHQINTTNDISCNNWISRNLMGNFNCHIAHHLFPHISYVYAPHITAVIKDYAMNHNLNYRAYTIGQALKYHYQLLKQNAAVNELFEDDM